MVHYLHVFPAFPLMKSVMLGILCLNIFFLHWALAERFEVVFPHMLTSRTDNNEKQLEVTAFGKIMTFRLRESPVLGPNLMIQADKDVPFVFTKEKLNELNSRLYQDPEQLSSLYIDTDGLLHIEGMLTEQLRIEPIPSLVSRSGEMAHRVTIISREDEEVEVPVREIYTRSPFHNDMRFPPVNISFDQIVDYDQEEDEISRQLSRGFRRTQNSGDMLVELLIIADQIHCAGFESEEEHIRYLATSVNAINLRFASVAYPKITVVITGILRSTSDETEPYITKNTYKDEYLLDVRALEAMGLYIENNYPKLKYDIAILYTGKDVIDLDTGRLETNVLGIAWVGAACRKNYRFGLEEDIPKTFSGVKGVAHEIGHLLGAPHDGDPAPETMPGSAGSRACPWKEGYIMSFVRAGERSHRFSHCSSSQFEFYRGMSQGACLRKTDGEVQASSNELPASMFSLEQICRSRYPNEEGVYVPNEVRRQKCEFSCCIPRMSRCSVHDTVDGTSCGTSQVCKAGKCQ